MENVFRWLDGGLITWENWLPPRDPNGKEAENCVLRDENGFWLDVPCSGHHTFFCQNKGTTAHSVLNIPCARHGNQANLKTTEASLFNSAPVFV